MKQKRRKTINRIMSIALWLTCFYTIFFIKSPLDMPIILVDSFVAGWLWAD